MNKRHGEAGGVQRIDPLLNLRFQLDGPLDIKDGITLDSASAPLLLGRLALAPASLDARHGRVAAHCTRSNIWDIGSRVCRPILEAHNLRPKRRFGSVGGVTV